MLIITSQQQARTIFYLNSQNDCITSRNDKYLNTKIYCEIIINNIIYFNTDNYCKTKSNDGEKFLHKKISSILTSFHYSWKRIIQPPVTSNCINSAASNQ